MTTYQAVLRVGDLELHELSRRVLLHGVPVRFTEFEFYTLWVLAKGASLIVSREELREAVGECYRPLYDRAVDMTISKIRRKLGDDARNPERIMTVRGEGYMLIPKEA